MDNTEQERAPAPIVAESHPAPPTSGDATLDAKLEAWWSTLPLSRLETPIYNLMHDAKAALLTLLHDHHHPDAR